MKLITKGLITIFTTSLLTQSLLAKTTICYKKDWKSPSTIETTKLDGGECDSKYSFNDMKKNGWSLKDIKIEKGKSGLNYIYLLTDEKQIKVDNSTFMENKYTKLRFKPIGTKLQNVNNDTATINIGNLRIGQSAVIQHNYPNRKSLLVANAYVTSSNNSSSTLKLVPFLDLKQNAIPTSNRKAQNGDLVILNYMYDSSLIVAPSQDAFTATREKYRDNNFLHSDLFGAKLKIEGEPLPSKETIQDFAISQNIGTLFFIIDTTIYIVDTKTFAVLDKDIIAYNVVEDKKMPFYTRVEKIEKSGLQSVLDYENWFSFLDRFIGDDKRSEEEILLEDQEGADELVFKGEIYNNYYKTLLGLK